MLPHFPLAQQGEGYHAGSQTEPQAPQLFTSLVISVQMPLQSAWPAGHAEQTPPTQFGAAPEQALPQAPQLPVSQLRSRHAVPQIAYPVGQTHVPPVHL